MIFRENEVIRDVVEEQNRALLRHDAKRRVTEHVKPPVEDCLCFLIELIFVISQKLILWPVDAHAIFRCDDWLLHTFKQNLRGFNRVREDLRELQKDATGFIYVTAKVSDRVITIDVRLEPSKYVSTFR